MSAIPFLHPTAVLAVLAAPCALALARRPVWRRWARLSRDFTVLSAIAYIGSSLTKIADTGVAVLPTLHSTAVLIETVVGALAAFLVVYSWVSRKS